MKNKEKKFLKSLILVSAIIFAVLFAVEVFIMNFTSLHLLTGKYKTQELDLEAAGWSNIYLDEEGVSLGKGYTAIYFDDINMPVGAITIDAKMNEGCDDATVLVSFTDETVSEYRRVIRYTLKERKKTDNIIVCNLSGKVDKLMIETTLNSDQDITLTGITLNKPRNSVEMAVIVFLTFAAVAFVAVLVYVFAGTKASLDPFERRRRFCTNAAVIITVCVMIFATSLSMLYTTKDGVVCYDSFTSLEGNQITKEIVYAFINGQVSLLQEPTEELLAMENPYDSIARGEAGLSYLWDHCLYNGKYYSYYGIGPVLALFLPYRLVTGFYFPSVWATLLFSLIGIVCLTKLYLLIIEKWFKKLPVGITLMGLITIQMASGIFFSAARPLFYEIAISSGFACVTAGAALLLSSNIIGEGKISYRKLCLSSCLLGYAVLCRPTLAVYCVAALLFIAAGIKKAIAEKEEQSKFKTLFKYAAASLVPFAVLGLVQMIYNYLRFDNPLDFGIQYSLTINDFTHSEFHWKFVLLNMYGYLFNMPRITASEFPFLESSFEYFDLNGYMFVDQVSTNLISVGIIYRALPMFSYLFAGKALKHIEKKKRPVVAVLVGVTCVLMPLIIIFSSWESGYSVRYNADISWPLITGALLIAFTLYNNCKSESVKKILNGVFLASTILCIYVNIAQIYSFMGMTMYL